MAGEGFLGPNRGMVLNLQRGDLKIAYGQYTTVAASDTGIATGLATVLAVTVTMEDAPTFDGTLWVHANLSATAGAIDVKSYEATGAADVTPVAATAFSKTVNWIAVGY